MANDPNTPEGGSGSGQDLASIQLQGVQYLGLIIQAIRTIFPSLLSTSTTATAGVRTLPANPAGFINGNLPDGTPIRIPYYLQ